MEDPRVTTRRATKPDAVDANLEIWSRELPELDLETEGIVERIHKLERLVDRAMQETLDAFDMSHGEWKVLANLRRAGPPYRGKPGKLAARLDLSSGAMTNRLDNMESVLGRHRRRPGGEGVTRRLGARRTREARAERSAPPPHARLRGRARAGSAAARLRARWRGFAPNLTNDGCKHRRPLRGIHSGGPHVGSVRASTNG